MKPSQFCRRTIALLGLSAWVCSAATTAHDGIEYWRTIPSVREFTKPRSFFPKLLEWVAGQAEKPEITRPYGLTQDSTGRLLVTDPGQKGVHLYDFEKHKYLFLKGPRGKLMESPIDVVCDRNDDIYVSDSGRRKVYVFDAKGRFLRWFGDSPSGGKLERPTGMAIDRSARRLYLTDTLRHQVLVFALDGAFVRAIGRRGTGDGEFNYPTSLTLSGGNLLVVDAMNFRVQTLGPEGNFLSAFGRAGNTSGTFNRPKGIAVDTEGNLYVPDALFETVQVFNPQGQLLYYFGATGSRAGQFQLPAGISIDGRNVVYVADSLNRRVQVFHFRRHAE